jgi:hypothetical protein
MGGVQDRPPYRKSPDRALRAGMDLAEWRK